ncbi:MAG: hypothetical protein ABFC63_00275 [Thermoguttaceae bacterium]
MKTYAIAFLLTVTMGLAVGSAAAKDDGCMADNSPCCQRCGCHCEQLQKVCHIVCTMKKETQTCWCVECEEIGLLMPGRRNCCEQCPPPRCSRTKCVQKLVKKEYQVEKPVYKCVVEYYCPTCTGHVTEGGSNAAPKMATPAPKPAPLPPAPAAPTPTKAAK